MTVITTDKLAQMRDIFGKVVEQTQLLFNDIAETAQDRARLLQEAEHREQAVDRLTGQVNILNGRLTDMEERNGVLSDELTQLESKLADATARLESISQTAKLNEIPPPRGNGDKITNAGKAGLAALQRLTAGATP